MHDLFNSVAQLACGIVIIIVKEGKILSQYQNKYCLLRGQARPHMNCVTIGVEKG